MKKILLLIIIAFIFTGCTTNANKYTVTFNSKGGTNVSSQIVQEGKKVKEPTPPTKSGYDFGCWLLNGEVYDFNAPVTSDITLVAVWYFVSDNIGMD